MYADWLPSISALVQQLVVQKQATCVTSESVQHFHFYIFIFCQHSHFKLRSSLKEFANSFPQ